MNKFLLLLIIGKVLDKVEFKENLEGKWGCKQKETTVPRSVCWGKDVSTNR